MKIIEKIKHLLNQTVENGCTEAEAHTAFVMARKLMIKHKITNNQINEKTNNIIKVELGYNCNEIWIYQLIKVFIDNFGIMSFMINKNEEMHIVLFGDKINVEAVRVLSACAYNYVEQQSEKYNQEYKALFGDDDYSFKDGYRLGFIRGVSDKYEEQNKQLNNEEALMIIPDKKIKKEFDNFTKDFTTKDIEYSTQSNNDTFNYIVMNHGYKEGRKFGTTPLKRGDV